jgi:hypothetical protein
MENSQLKLRNRTSLKLVVRGIFDSLTSHTSFTTFSIVTTKIKTLNHKKHNVSEEASSETLCFYPLYYIPAHALYILYLIHSIFLSYFILYIYKTVYFNLL